MDLVLKINDKCNFACEFCSSNKIALDHKDLDINIVKDFLLKHRVYNIIVNGGDPLLVEPEYYWELLNFIEDNNLPAGISFTSNMWEFYKNPDKWLPLFEHIDVCTSFQYGNKRKLADGRVFTEDMFVEIFNLYKERTKKYLNFIAVIDEDNEDTVIQTVELAKRLHTHCRLNGAVRSGKTTKAYPFYKMMEHYCSIMEAGLGLYEDNCQIIKRIITYNTLDNECPFNKYCHSELACISPDGTVHNCPSIADDIHSREIDKAYIYHEIMEELPLEDMCISDKCYICAMYNLCCSCTKRIQDIKEAQDNYNHCNKMQELYPRILSCFTEG